MFKAFFGHNGPPPGILPGEGAPTSQEADDDEFSGDDKSSVRPPPSTKSILTGPPTGVHRGPSSSIFAMPEPKTPPNPSEFPFHRRKESMSLSDIVARDAAQGYVLSFLSVRREQMLT